MIKAIDSFSKNIILVFLGTSLVNLFNLLYQLLIAHALSPADFAAFNSLLSIFMIISTPLVTLQTAVIKYTAEFNAQNQTKKIRTFLSVLFKKTSIFSLFSLVIFYFISFYIMDKLKISSIASAYILTLLIASSWVIPVLSGGLQGLELFKWFTSISVLAGAAKLILAFLFILIGFNIAGALGASLASNTIVIIISYLLLRNFISFKTIQEPVTNKTQDAITLPLTMISNGVNFKEIFIYLFPVAISTFCFITLVSSDMVLVKYFFGPQDSGLYSLAQMVGKIFLFLPGAIGIVMFPRTSGLDAKNIDTVSTLKKSFLYAIILCIIAILGYNIVPSFVLTVLTGKAFLESIVLGRLFSISMTFFALLYILILYLLSKKDLRFIKYLVLFTLLQFFAIVLFHNNLMQVQLILCINAILLFFIHLVLVYKDKGQPPAGDSPSII